MTTTTMYIEELSEINLENENLTLYITIPDQFLNFGIDAHTDAVSATKSA